MRMHTVWKDLRLSLRLLSRNRGFAVVSLLTLAIGIGASTAIFSFVDAVLLKPLPYETADRIIRALEMRPNGETAWISTPDFLDWREQSTALEELAALQHGLVTLDGDEPVALRVGRVSANFFDVFGAKAQLGRTFAAGEDAAGRSNVVVLSNALWQSRFGGDDAVVGRSIVLDDAPVVVVGVLSADSAFDRDASQLWQPLVLDPAAQSRSYRWINAAFGLMKPGVSVEEARAQLAAIAARTAEVYPDSNRGWGIDVARYADSIVGHELATSLLVLLGAVGGLLLICCANVANLLLARGIARDGEVGVRVSLGATRGHLLQQLLCENFVLAGAGGVLGLGVSYGAIVWFRSLVPPGALPGEAAVQLDWRAVAFAVCVSLVTAILFGLGPLVRMRNADLAGGIAAARKGSTPGRRSRRLLDTVVVGEVTISVLLLCCSALLIRSFVSLTSVERGFDAHEVLTMRLPVPGFPPGSQYSSVEEFKEYVRQIRGAAESIPGVRAAALTNSVPLTDCCLYTLSAEIEGRPSVDRANRRGGLFKVVTPSYFRTLGLTLVRGRFLDEADSTAGRKVAVVNERLATRYFGAEDPIGQRLLNPEIIPGQTQRGADVAWEIVGVVSNEKISSLADDDSAVLYASYDQSPVYFTNLVVAGGADAASLEEEVRRTLRRVNAAQAILDVRTLEGIEAGSVDRERLQTALLGSFALVALVLASVGIFGLLHHSMLHRRQEIGIRAALGASPSRLLRQVVGRGLSLTAGGIALGLVAAYGLAPLLAPLLYRTDPHEPSLMVAVSIVLSLVGLCASAGPAIRAARVAPHVVLRGD